MLLNIYTSLLSGLPVFTFMRFGFTQSHFPCQNLFNCSKSSIDLFGYYMQQSWTLSRKYVIMNTGNLIPTTTALTYRARYTYNGAETLSHWCVLWIFSSILIILLGRGVRAGEGGGGGRGLICFALVCGLNIVCHGLFPLSFGIIGRLWSVIVVLPGHQLYYCSDNYDSKTKYARVHRENITVQWYFCRKLQRKQNEHERSSCSYCFRCSFISFKPYSVPWEGCVSWLWSFLGISIAILCGCINVWNWSPLELQPFICVSRNFKTANSKHSVGLHIIFITKAKGVVFLTRLKYESMIFWICLCSEYESSLTHLRLLFHKKEHWQAV